MTAFERDCFDLTPFVGTEIIIGFFFGSDDLVERTVEAIIDSAKTGKVGDGKIFISSLEQVWRIRTGETGDGAL